MKTIKYLLLFFMLTFGFAKQKQKKIGVLLEKNVKEALLEVRGPYYIFNPYDNSKIGSGILEKRFIVRPTVSGIKWGQVFPSTNQMKIVPRTKETSILVNGIQYEGTITIYKINNKINLVNEISVEDYIKSILSTKFDFPLEHEAMASVAIACRTSAYFQIEKNNNKNNFWHVDKNIVNYEGSALLIEDSEISKAVDNTKNIVILNGEHKPFKANWTEHSAGITAPFHSIFRKDFQAPKQGVKAPLAKLDRDNSKWSFSIPNSALSNKINLSKINTIELFQDKESKKTYAIRFKDKDQTKDVNFFTLQKILGKNNLQSNDFRVIVDYKNIYFEGHGKGHGVGICLYSASLMSQNGENAVKILSKFFPNTYITNISLKK